MTIEEMLKQASDAVEYDDIYDLYDIFERLLNDIDSRKCENCKHGLLSWIAVDGRDIRESQYPPMIECGGKLREPQWYCADFERIVNE